DAQLAAALDDDGAGGRPHRPGAVLHARRDDRGTAPPRAGASGRRGRLGLDAAGRRSCLGGDGRRLLDRPRRLSRAVWLCLLGLVAIVPASADDLARELPRIAPKTPDEALKAFRIHDGFRLVPVAVEPLVTDPVAACYDEDGRLYVVEMRGYPYPE